MVWVKLTDRHPHEASRAGLSSAARCLHMDALCWIMANDHETVHISQRDLIRLSEQDHPEAIAPELVVCGWWLESLSGGWDVVHDIAVQRTNEQILADREANAQRQARSRERGRVRNGVTNGGSNGSPDQTSTRPVVTPIGVTTQNQRSLVGTSGARRSNEDDGSREDVERLCVHLADCIEGNGFSRPQITKTWRRDMRLLLDRDGHTEEDIHKAIAWCQADAFWYKNIRSPEKLRAKYERLQADAKDEKNGRRTISKQAETDDLFDEAQRRAEEREAAMEADQRRAG